MNERIQHIFELVRSKLIEAVIPTPEPSAREKLERAEMPKRTWKGKGPEPKPVISKITGKPVTPGMGKPK